MSDFVKEIHNMFDHIWDREIDHPVYQDTVGELMEAVIQVYEKHKPTLSTNLAEVGTDLISKQAAIDALNEYFARIGKLKRRGLTKGEKAISLDTVGAIKTLPPIQPKRGRWIKLDMHRGMADHKCTACDQECYVPTCMGEPMYAFCPNCGARMEVTT